MSMQSFALGKRKTGHEPAKERGKTKKLKSAVEGSSQDVKEDQGAIHGKEREQHKEVKELKVVTSFSEPLKPLLESTGMALMPRMTVSQLRSLAAFRADLRGLTIKQPVAWAIQSGFKKVENRSWSFKIEQDGKWFVLHASGQPLKALDSIIERVDSEPDGTVLPRGRRLADLRTSAPRSVLLGLVVCALKCVRVDIVVLNASFFV
jgi:hypothetical protein